MQLSKFASSIKLYMKLSNLKTGEKAVIVKVKGHGSFRKRIVEMGFVRGKTVEVLLNAPLNDPIKYKVLGYEISLRRQEAEMIDVICTQDAESKDIHSLDISELHNQKGENDKAVSINREKGEVISVALVGNPNCGKTSLFNIASGSHEHVGNYSGVTVDAKEGFFKYRGYKFKIVDLPGTYSLSAYSPEELYVRKHIIEETPDVIVNVIDASNIERNLYLTTQLIDMNVKVVSALNIYDELEAKGDKLDYKLLGSLLGVPMIPTSSKKGRGVNELFDAVIAMYEDDEKSELIKHARHIHINHGKEIERAIEDIKVELLKSDYLTNRYYTRFLALKLLEGDKDVEKEVSKVDNAEEILSIRDKSVRNISTVMNEECESAITDAKYAFINGALKETYTESGLQKNQKTKLIDSVVAHKYLGFPLFFVIVFLMFQATFTLGQYPMDGIEWLVGYVSDFFKENMTDGALKDLIIDGIIGGVGGVIVFLPNILILYLCISILEDSGYMARAAFIMDKVMHKMGLHGKSFIPLIMGFGCNVPAVMATRTIENRKSRLITMLVNPFMSCSARLAVYMLLVGTFFPKHGGLVLFSLYVIGMAIAVIVARVLSKYIVKGDDVPFVMELPPYRMPTTLSVARHTWEKGVQYLKKMGGIIMIASIIIWFLGYYPQGADHMSKQEQQENSYIGKIGKAMEPVISPMGWDWKMGIGLITGAAAKEIVVSTLGVLYVGDDEAEEQSIGEKMPITPLSAYCYMLFVLIYFPCIATLVAIKHESGSWKWALFSAVNSTLLAWIISFSVYKIGMLIL